MHTGYVDRPIVSQAWGIVCRHQWSSLQSAIVIVFLIVIVLLIVIVFVVVFDVMSLNFKCRLC